MSVKRIRVVVGRLRVDLVQVLLAIGFVLVPHAWFQYAAASTWWLLWSPIDLVVGSSYRWAFWPIPNWNSFLTIITGVEPTADVVIIETLLVLAALVGVGVVSYVELARSWANESRVNIYAPGKVVDKMGPEEWALACQRCVRSPAWLAWYWLRTLGKVTRKPTGNRQTGIRKERA